MQHFGYMKYIPRDPHVSAPPAMTCRDMSIMFDDYLNHLVPEETRSTITSSDWSNVDGYIRWLFRISHPYIRHDALEDPPMPTHRSTKGGVD